MNRSGRQCRGRSGGGQENTRVVGNLTYQPFLAGSRLDTFTLDGVFQLVEFIQLFDPAQPSGSLVQAASINDTPLDLKVDGRYNRLPIPVGSGSR
jgi:hypothetical protein